MYNRKVFQPEMSLDSDIRDTQSHIDKYDPKLMRWLVNMHNSLNGDKIDMANVGSLMDMLKHLYDEDSEQYLKTLLYPENECGKIPSRFPVPSTKVHEHLTYNITTNASGNYAFTYNPFRAGDQSSSASSSFFLNTNAALSGSSTSGFFGSTDIGQNAMPSNMYTMYRLVSAAITINYVGRMDIVSGTIGGAIGLNKYCDQQLLAGSVADFGSSLYGNFNLIDDAYYGQRTQSVNGLRMIYFPLDEAFLQFRNLDSTQTGFYFVSYGAGLPINSPCIRLDFHLNFEFTVHPSYNNYISTAPGPQYSGDVISLATSTLAGNPGLIIQPSGDSPGKSSIASGGWFSKMLGRAGRVTSDAMNIAKYVPGIGVIANYLGLAGAGVSALVGAYGSYNKYTASQTPYNKSSSSNKSENGSSNGGENGGNGGNGGN